MNQDIKERAIGCLLGQIAGDSLGSLVEFKSVEACRRVGLKLKSGGPFNLLAGQPTDDSEQALALARSLVRNRGYVVEDTARSYVRWYNSHPFDYGSTTSAAMERVPYNSRAENIAASMARKADPDSQSNGSLMRCSPMGIAYCSPADVYDDGMLTHPHEFCRSACYIFTDVIRLLIHGHLPISVIISRQLTLMRDDRGSVYNALYSAYNGDPPVSYTENKGWVVTAFHNAFYQLVHAKDFRSGVHDTVIRGGDTDTNAAVAGALLGAFYGRTYIPGQWQEAMFRCQPWTRPIEYWPTDAEEVAEQLAEIGNTARITSELPG